MTAEPARAQRERRILDAAATLASQGGWEAVRMRAVAAGSGVAVATLYRYFPSKVQLLLTVLRRELERTQDRIDRTILRGDSAGERVLVLISGLTNALQRDRRLTAAMLRAYLLADGVAAGGADGVARALDDALAGAMANTSAPADADLAAARIVRDCWLADLGAWSTGRLAAGDVPARTSDVVRIVVPRRGPGR